MGYVGVLLDLLGNARKAASRGLSHRTTNRVYGGYAREAGWGAEGRGGGRASEVGRERC